MLSKSGPEPQGGLQSLRPVGLSAGEPGPRPPASADSAAPTALSAAAARGVRSAASLLTADLTLPPASAAHSVVSCTSRLHSATTQHQI